MDRGRKLAGIVTPADSDDSCLKNNQGKPLENKTVRHLVFLQGFHTFLPTCLRNTVKRIWKIHLTKSDSCENPRQGGEEGSCKLGHCSATCRTTDGRRTAAALVALPCGLDRHMCVWCNCWFHQTPDNYYNYYYIHQNWLCLVHQ